MNDRVGRVLRRASGRSPAFELAYVRSGPRTQTPTVVVPGGPGLGSILPYRRLRGLAARGGLDLVMVEHRGVGFSRKDCSGEPLPHSAMWIAEVVDDIAAVLDREGVRSAYLAGSSYGSYVASSFGVRHPDRVAGMVLDSALQSVGDLALERELVRRLFWNSDTPVATAVRRLAASDVDERQLLDVVRAAHELGGEQLTRPLLENRLRYRFSPAWRALGLYANRDESIVRIPGHYEFAIAGAIGFRELNYAAVPDGLPLDPALTYAGLADRFPPFQGEPFDLPSETPVFDWPLVLLAGTRDVRTPPEIAHRVARTARHGVIVEIENGHSALDTHPAALLNAIRALVSGTHERLPGMAARLDRLPRRGFAARLPALLGAVLRLEGALRR
jgi:pimeloyl-ACP methyl ester carboxylesterase